MLIRAYCLCGHRLSQEMFKKNVWTTFLFLPGSKKDVQFYIEMIISNNREEDGGKERGSVVLKVH